MTPLGQSDRACSCQRRPLHALGYCSAYKASETLESKSRARDLAGQMNLLPGEESRFTQRFHKTRSPTFQKSPTANALRLARIAGAIRGVDVEPRAERRASEAADGSEREPVLGTPASLASPPLKAAGAVSEAASGRADAAVPCEAAGMPA